MSEVELERETHIGSLRGTSWHQLPTVSTTRSASVHFVASVPMSSALGNLPESFLVGLEQALTSTYHPDLQRWFLCLLLWPVSSPRAALSAAPSTAYTGQCLQNECWNLGFESKSLF